MKKMLRKFKITIDGKTYLVEMEEIGGAPAAQPAPAAPATPAATPTPAPATPAASAPAAPV
ncbi:acetyl-CoA carboxylase biotin carboxyl carrier protein subunit, partial [Lacticaseibacillus paracasei subsp. paracasei Lpp221]